MIVHTTVDVAGTHTSVCASSHVDGCAKMSASSPPAQTPETWKALAFVGVLFPLHIICGILTVPYLCFKLYSGSVGALVFLCCCALRVSIPRPLDSSAPRSLNLI